MVQVFWECVILHLLHKGSLDFNSLVSYSLMAISFHWIWISFLLHCGAQNLDKFVLVTLLGYCFLLFQDELSVQTLIDACISEDGKLFWLVSSPTMKDKMVRMCYWFVGFSHLSSLFVLQCLMKCYFLSDSMSRFCRLQWFPKVLQCNSKCFQFAWCLSSKGGLWLQPLYWQTDNHHTHLFLC